MIADIAARICAADWSAIADPREIEEYLRREQLLLKTLPPRNGAGAMHLFLLHGSSRETGELVMVEYTRGPFLTRLHGYPVCHGAPYGQRIWSRLGTLRILPDGAGQSIQTVEAGEVVTHQPGEQHQALILDRWAGLIHQPRGSCVLYR